MGKIYVLMGKSASGKDALFQDLLQQCPDLRTVILYTTRPLRDQEKDGVTYFFVTEETLEDYRKAGKVIESRTYATLYGDWTYATIDDGQVDLSAHDYLLIGTLESYGKLQAYFGADQVVPLYLEVEDGERLQRALHRERQQAQPKYDEMCRRFLADQQDFSEEHLQEAGITKRFQNGDREACLQALLEEIKHGKFS